MTEPRHVPPILTVDDLNRVRETLGRIAGQFSEGSAERRDIELAALAVMFSHGHQVFSAYRDYVRRIQNPGEREEREVREYMERYGIEEE